MRTPVAIILDNHYPAARIVLIVFNNLFMYEYGVLIPMCVELAKLHLSQTKKVLFENTFPTERRGASCNATEN